MCEEIGNPNQLYMGRQLYIHYNLMQHRILHVLCSYHIMTLLHYMAILSSPTWDLLCHDMVRGEGSIPIYKTPWLSLSACLVRRRSPRASPTAPSLTTWGRTTDDDEPSLHGTEVRASRTPVTRPELLLVGWCCRFGFRWGIARFPGIWGQNPRSLLAPLATGAIVQGICCWFREFVGWLWFGIFSSWPYRSRSPANLDDQRDL